MEKSQRGNEMSQALNEKEKKEIINSIMENLPVLRAKARITQEQLAEKLGVTRQTIINIESKKTRITWPMVLAILLIFIHNPLTFILLGPLGILNRKLLELVGLNNFINILNYGMNDKNEEN